MPIAMLMEIPGCTQQQYDDVMADLELQELPDGGLCHISSPMEGGWRVLDVWESQEKFDRFFQDRLQGALQRANIPMTGPPRFAELHNYMSTEYAPAPSPAG